MFQLEFRKNEANENRTVGYDEILLRNFSGDDTTHLVEFFTRAHITVRHARQYSGLLVAKGIASVFRLWWAIRKDEALLTGLRFHPDDIEFIRTHVESEVAVTASSVAIAATSRLVSAASAETEATSTPPLAAEDVPPWGCCSDGGLPAVPPCPVRAVSDYACAHICFCHFRCVFLPCAHAFEL